MRSVRLIGFSVRSLKPGPQVLRNVSRLNADAIFAVLVFLGLHLLVLAFHQGRIVYCALSGILLGLGTLVKPIGLFLPLILMITGLIYVWRVRARTNKSEALFLVIVLFVSSVPAVAWTYRNHRLSGHLSFVPKTGFHLALHNLRTIKELNDRNHFLTDDRKSEFVRVAAETDSIHKTLLYIREMHHLDIFEAEAIAKEVALTTIWERPLRYLSDTLWHTLRNFGSPEDALGLVTLFWDSEPFLRTPFGEAFRRGAWFDVLFIMAIRLLNLTFLLGIPAAILAMTLPRGRVDLSLCLIVASAVLYLVVFTGAIVPGKGRYLLPVFYSLLYSYCVLAPMLVRGNPLEPTRSRWHLSTESRTAI